MFTVNVGSPVLPPLPPPSKYLGLMEAIRSLRPGTYIKLETSAPAPAMIRNIRVAIKRFWPDGEKGTDWRPRVTTAADGSVVVYRSDDVPSHQDAIGGPVEPLNFSVSVVPSKAQVNLRCAWCRDPINAGKNHVSCQGCGSKRCESCYRMKCPTIGCD